MTRDQLYDTIRETLRDQFEIPEESITLQLGKKHKDKNGEVDR